MILDHKNVNFFLRMIKNNENTYFVSDDKGFV